MGGTGQDTEDGGSLWGVHPILELLRLDSKKLREILIQQGKAGRNIKEIVELARQQGVKLRFLPGERFPGAGDKNHQGVLARISPVATLSLDELIAGAQGVQHPLIIALDSIQDPHNLGAIIRTAAAAGAVGVVLPKDRSAPINATVAKTAAGALAHIRLCLVTNLAASLEKLKEKGFWVYGAAGEAQKSLYEHRFSGPVCLVIGGEGKGLRPLVRKHCDELLAIPMLGRLNSLNASVAAGVILFEILRQQRQG